MPKSIATITALCACLGATVLQAESSPRPIALGLNGTNWKLGSFAPGEGEARQAFLPSFDDSAFRAASVPGEVQLQLGLKGMDLYYQSRELTLVNDKEWWYGVHFVAPQDASGKLVRLAFDGVDYFATVWLNGQKLGDHEGAYSRFVFDVGSKLRYGGDNLIVVKVTCPWMPKGRAAVEYMKGSLSFIPDSPLPKLPYSMGGHWDGVPAGGNAALSMGISRDVTLLISEPVILEDLAVHTKALHEDGSATLTVSGNVRSYGSGQGAVTASFEIGPANFAGAPLRLADRQIPVRSGSNPFEFEAVVKAAHLWWTWDSGPQNLYRMTASLSPGAGGRGDAREMTFGIRTILREKDLSYRLNGKRIFLKGAWYPMGDAYGSIPTHARYETDLRLFRSTNGNHLINYTVVEKTEFYDLCDELGILIFIQLPFSQDGPHEVLGAGNPRREPFTRAAMAQVRDIVTALRNHPSIAQWSPLAEARDSGKWSGPQEGYQSFVDEIGAIVNQLAPDTLYHPSLCDLGEKHFWTGSNHDESIGPYQELFDSKALLISEYGAMSMPSYGTLKEVLSPEDLWSDQNAALPEWFHLPINVSAYAYVTSYEYNGLFTLLHRVNQFVDRDVRSLNELIDDSQLYQGFVYKYATEAFRREKYHPVNGTRIWDFVSVHPGISFNFLDYRRVPKLGFYYFGQTEQPLTLSFAYKPALESQVSGKRLSIPVWVVNDHPESAQLEVACDISEVSGKLVWQHTYRPAVAADSSVQVATIDWTAPEKGGIYVLRGRIAREGRPVATNTTFIKVTPRAFARGPRVLLLGDRRSAGAIAALLEAAGVQVDTIDGGSLERLALLRDASVIRRQYDVVWLASFDRVWKVLEDSMAAGLEKAIAEGVGFIHTGGEGSFHGGANQSACLDFTRLADVLPVTGRKRNDLVYPGVPDAQTPRSLARLRNIETPDRSGRWTDQGLRAIGIPGFNDVDLKPGTALLMTVGARPLLVAGSYGKGRTVAFTGFTPVEPVDPEFLDQAFVQTPATRPYFELFLRMLAEASGEPEAFAPGELLAMREKPLFQSLKELPAAALNAPDSVSARIVGRAGELSLHLGNGDRYARLVRVRAEFDDARSKPDVVLFHDNYFDLLPGEERSVVAELLYLGSPPLASVRGRLIVEGSNLPVKEIPITLEPGGQRAGGE